MDQWLARKLLEQDRKIEAVSRSGIGIGNSSVTGGTLEVEGEHAISLSDGGINYIAGPPPPKPTAPTLQAGVGSIFVTWDGLWAEANDADEAELDTEAPLDFDRIEVHCSTDPAETDWGEDTLQGEIKAKAGGTVMVRGGEIDDEVFVCLIGLSKAGEHGEASDTASIIIEGIDIATITNELDAANVDLSNLNGDMFAAGAEIDAAKIALKNVDLAVISTDDGTLADALSDARDLSAELANQAKADAIADAAGKDSTLKSQIDSTIAQTRTDLEGGISSAEARAKAEAKTLADSAREAAKSAAATDATAKADAAQAAAISSAQAKATALADAAKADAINFTSTRVFGPTQIADNAITTAKLAAGAVTADDIKAGSVGAVALAANAITAEKIQAGAVGAAAIAAASIEGQHVKANAITADKVAANAIGARAIAADAIEAGKIAANAVTSREIIANAITAEKIVGLAVTTEKLAALAVSADKIAANAVVAGKIAANAVTAGTIAALAVTAGKLAANAVTADKLAANAVTAGSIQAGAINGMKIVGPDIFTSETGTRVHLGAVGLESFDANNRRTFFADAATGNVSMVGSFYSNEDGNPRVEIDNDDWASIGIVDPDGVKRYTNGSGIRIGSTAMSGFSIYHGHYTISGTVSGQAGVIDGPLGLSNIFLDGTGQLWINSLDSQGAIRARLDLWPDGGSALRSLDPAGVDRAALTTTSLSEYHLASITARNSSGAEASTVETWDNGDIDIRSTSRVSIDAPAIRGLPMASGTGSTGTMVANTPKAVVVKFPTGRFKSPPVVMVTVATTVPGTTVTGWSVASVTATQCTVYVTRTNTTSTSFHWFAVENDY